MGWVAGYGGGHRVIYSIYRQGMQINNSSKRRLNMIVILIEEEDTSKVVNPNLRGSSGS